jgi:hypothetical protein
MTVDSLNFLKRIFGKTPPQASPIVAPVEPQERKENKAPKPAAPKGKAESTKHQQLLDLEAKFREKAPDIYPYARSFRPPYGKYAVHFVNLARELGSKAPITVFREAADKYPTSGLAWYTLNFAITMCDSPNNPAAAEALGRAAKYGCDYVKIKDGTITISPIE